MPNRLTRVLRKLREKNTRIRRKNGYVGTVRSEFVLPFVVFACLCVFILICPEDDFTELGPPR